MIDQNRLEDVAVNGKNTGQRPVECLADDPRCFLVGRTLVRVSFRPQGETLEKKLTAYLLGLKV